MVTEVNAVHAGGFGLTGTTGANFFGGDSAATISVNQTLLDNPSLLQLGGTPGNAGDNVVALALAQEEVERIRKIRTQRNKRNFFGAPDERIAFLKNLWWKMPLYWRPFVYFFIRFFIQLGVLDGKQGRLFHFLQAFWFRLMVDVKIEELLRNEKVRQADKVKEPV